MSTTGRYYDRLSRWTALARWVGYGGGRSALTVHRFLSDPRANGRPTPTRLHDILVERLLAREGVGDSPRVLDAGCGLGGTMIDLAERLGGRYVGLTLSETQARTARQAIAQRGLESRVVVHVRDYDDPPDGPFDVIIAIESLAHSRDPAHTLVRLADRLAPRGLIVIVDDMPATTSPEPENPRTQDTTSYTAWNRDACDRALEAFKIGWGCPVLWSADAYHRHAPVCGLAVVEDRDLTSQLVPRRLASLDRLEHLNRWCAAIVPIGGCRDVLRSYAGGLALERLYRHRGMSYRLLIAQRVPSP